MSAIDEIKDRLQDLTEALRDAGCRDLHGLLQSYADDFTVQTRVRRSVNAIRTHLQHWREHPEELPDSARITLAANRLEDVCRDALAAGVVSVAGLTLGAQLRRKLLIAAVTLLCGGAVMAVPFGLVRAGVDPSEWGKQRKLALRRLPRGEEDSVRVFALARALLPQAVTGVDFFPLGRCRERLPNDARCVQTSERLWAEGRLPTYEIKLPHQTYGLLFAVPRPHALRGFGAASLLLAATDDTPEGLYEIPFTATYHGYTPQACELLERLRGRCPGPRKGQGERHVGVAVPVVVVEVVSGDPSRRLGEKRRGQAEAEERRRKAEQRAQQIGAALSQIDALIAQTRKLIGQRRWEQVHDRVQNLTSLFQPLDVLALAHDESDVLPADITQVRARFEVLRDKLDEFEDRVFEKTFAVVVSESNRRVAEERLLLRIADQFGISAKYVESIYTERADEIERRIQAREQAHIGQLKAEQQARERRCGSLPQGAWQAVQHYIARVYEEPHVELALGECMTARLTERDCWAMRCDYVRKFEVAVERPKIVTKHQAEFYFEHGRIVRHRE